ncbi:CHASE2 domain-containing protein [Microbacterium sp. NPDC056569]|uniref:CHASE2 domain-containing protein n=1 Tax=Microbacterium sp. NPDC056569 TaxID=3345867 RepID=UPI00366E9387
MTGSGESRNAPPAWLTILAIGLLASTLTVGSIVLGFGGDAARRASDLLWPSSRVDPDVIVVQIDAPSQEVHGAWPWTRDQQADLVDAIAEGGAVALGYDIIPAEDAPGAGDPLATALARIPTVMPTTYTSIVRNERGLYAGSEPVRPAVAFEEAAAGVGHVVVPSDADGVIRRIPLVVETTEGDLLAAFCLQLALIATGDDVDPSPLVRPRTVEAGAFAVPVEDAAALRVWWGRGLEQNSPPVLSAAEVMDGSGKGRLDGAIVLVGVADTTIGDTHITPLQPGATTPGVIVQAQALSTILTSAWVGPAPWWVSGLIALVLAAVSAAVASRARLWIAVTTTLLLVGAYLGVALLLLPAAGLQLDLVRVPAAIIGAAVAGGAVRLIAEQRSRRAAVELFTRYVPRTVASRLLESDGQAVLADGVRVSGAVVFCDLRGFTALAESMDPADVRRALDIYYEFACTRVFAHGGTVMQFVGDEVFAVFGAPEHQPDPVSSARETAARLVGDVDVLEETLRKNGLPELRFGIGVHAGELVAATVGPESRRQYAVVGDVVNVGSRLCGAAAAGEIVVSCVAAGDEWRGLPGEALSLKGKSATIDVVRVRSVDPAQRT